MPTARKTCWHQLEPSTVKGYRWHCVKCDKQLKVKSGIVTSYRSTDGWITYSRPYSPNTHITRTASEKPPIGFPHSRAALDSEIQAEIARRAEREQTRQEYASFTTRLDYKDAMIVHDVLEFMTPNQHPLDKLTPEEWAALAERLTEDK